MELVITVVGKIAEYTVAPVLRQFGYLIYYKSQVEDLTEKITTLTAKRDGVQQRVEAEKRNLQVILPQVQNWLDRVNLTIQEKETCFERGRVDKATTCCSSGGWCPNLKVRHSLSRKAAKMAPKVDDLITEGHFTTISCPPPPKIEDLVEDLTEKITTLTAMRDGVLQRVEAEERNSQVILRQVQNWLDRVNWTIQEKETCFERGRVDKATTDQKVRDSLSREAAKMALKVDDLIKGGDFTIISSPPPPPKIGYQVIPYFEDSIEAPAKPHDEGASSSSGTSALAKPHAAMDPSERLKYRFPYTKDLLTTLQDDKISVIGISGRFREIDTVSTKEFTKRIKQRDLFEEVMLDLTLENGSLVQRAEWLRAVLPASDSKRILVILTDVWGILDLEEIGISRVEIKKGCKIVLISQLSDVFGEIETQSNFKLLSPSTPERRPVEFESRISVIRDVMDALTDDEFNPIVICGMGGIGKTTLLMEIAAKASEVDLFDEIAIAEITQQPDLIKIQGKIARDLGLKLEADDDRAAKLRTRLSEDARKVLVVLDDVWTDLNLWEVGIPESCKLLVSSRNRDIFKQMKTKKNFPIGGLTEDDGWSLFKKMTGRRIESEPEMLDIAKQVLNACDGLPVAISTVGKALQGESLPKWRDALRQLRKACPEDVPGVIKNVYGKIELSYQCLPSEQAKSCFLLCCLFAKSQDVPTEVFNLIGLGLGLFKGIDSISEGRDNVKALFDTLKTRCLLLDGEEEGCYKMHDVVYDVAMYIASEESTPKKKDQLQRRLVLREGMEWNDWRHTSNAIEQPIHYRSLTTNMNTTEVSRLLGNRKQELLGLFGNSKPELSASIFDGMKDLKVLVIRNLVLPSLPLWKKLQVLALAYCLVTSVDIIGKLHTLMILTLDGSDVKQLPDTFKNLSNLRVLSLSNCLELKVISPGVISSLSCLEELYMLGTFAEWPGWVVDKMASTETTNWISQLEVDARPEEVHMWRKYNNSHIRVSNLNAEQKESMKRWGNSMDWTVGILSELLSLSTLTTLEVSLPPLEILLTDCKLFNKLESFKISIGWEYHKSKSWRSSENCLKVDDLDASCLGGISVLLKKTKTLELKMKNLTEPHLNCCAKLESLTLEDCDSLEYLIDTTLNQDTPGSIFPVLNELSINGGRRLKEIFHGDLPPRSLQKLSITDCESLESIFSWEESGDHEEEAEAKEINFSALQYLTLSKLPNWRGISKSSCKRGQVTSNALFGDPKLAFPVLKVLYIKGLGNFENIWNNQRPSPNSFCELKYLHVDGCHNLLHLVPTQMQNGLQKLEEIEVGDCSSLKQIFEVHEANASISQSNNTPSNDSQPGQAMQMNDIMDFKISCQGFQNLTKLQVYSCGNLRDVLSPSIARGLVKLKRISIRNCEKIEEIVLADEGEGTEDENMLPRLSDLTLESLPNLESFSQGKYTFDWPLMGKIRIVKCNKMNKFCLGSLSIRREVRIYVSDRGENVEQELKESRKES